MLLKVFNVSIALFIFSVSHADEREARYSICHNVGTTIVADPYKDMSLIFNYSREKDMFVILRCNSSSSKGLLNRAQSSNCHVVRSGSENQLCQLEKTNSQVSKVISEIVETGVSSILSGGVSHLQRFQSAISAAKNLNVDPSCIGIELIKSIAQNSDSKDVLLDLYYNNQTQLGPFSGISSLVRGNSPKLRAEFVFQNLNSLMIGGHGSSQNNKSNSVTLTGPPYITVHRSRSSLEASISPQNAASFCSLFQSSPVSLASPKGSGSSSTVK